MKVTIEWSKEELETMIREKLEIAGFEPADDEAIQWKTRPALHIVIQANPCATVGNPAEPVHTHNAPRLIDGFHGDGKLPAHMFPEGAALDELTAAAAAEDPLARVASLRPMHPGESNGDPRDNDDK